MTAPNRYELAGVGPAPNASSVEIVYGRDGLEIDTHIGGGTHAIMRQTFARNEIHSVAVEFLGTCVSFTMAESFDGTSRTGTLLIPNVLVDADTSSGPVETILIDTRHSPAGNGSVESQKEHYTVIKLTGTATRESE
jgi:hypothetical protein